MLIWICQPNQLHILVCQNCGKIGEMKEILGASEEIIIRVRETTLITLGDTTLVLGLIMSSRNWIQKLRFRKQTLVFELIPIMPQC